MSKVYQGHTTELYELFLKGTELQYKKAPWYDWDNIPVYNGRANDIYRVANPNYEFRVKPTEVIVKKYTFYDRIERYVTNSEDLNKMAKQFWYDKPKPMEEMLEWTFTDGKLTSITIL